mmetsp:Transcript_21456/g.54026  ORF Transcript_21456/g.54026 Transcript_21456/m.54026 type:complete len:634 (-) Transcript_21456:1786-3687(-)|eukprot:jgi/Tetstr1/432446/TSEL_021822.t1
MSFAAMSARGIPPPPSASSSTLQAQSRARGLAAHVPHGGIRREIFRCERSRWNQPICRRRRPEPLAAVDEDAAMELSGEERAALDEEARLLVEKLEQLDQEYAEEDEDEEDGGLLAGLLAEMVSGRSDSAATKSKNIPISMRARRKAGIKEKELPVAALPKVAVVGRPNVGKSAMFNRICGKQMAIVYDQPGVTRDRMYTRAFWGDKEFVVVDTGGLLSRAQDLPTEVIKVQPDLLTEKDLPDSIEWQAAAGIFEADSVLFMVDGQQGLTGADREVLDWLRVKQPGKPVILAVNKCENPQKADLQAAEFWELGVQPYPVSAISGTGTGEMLEALVASLPPPKTREEVDVEDEPLAIAIIGRPNVGKSSLINALCGEERTIVSSIAGTTRDAIDTILLLNDGTKLKLIDTAGIRKRTKVAAEGGAEALSVQRAFAAVKRADIVVMVVDAGQGITEQDFKLAEYASQQGVGCVVVINKWDTVEKETSTMNDYEADYRSQLRAVPWAPYVFTSALTGQRVKNIIGAVLDVGEQYQRRITTGVLNVVLQEAVGWRTPPSKKNGKKGRIFYATQAGTKPPTFVLFVNDTDCFQEDYRNYIEKQLRQNIGFQGTPIRLFWRGKAKGNSEERRAAGYGYR